MIISCYHFSSNVIQNRLLKTKYTNKQTIVKYVKIHYQCQENTHFYLMKKLQFKLPLVLFFILLNTIICILSFCVKDDFFVLDTIFRRAGVRQDGSF